ncbi:SMF protein, Rossmann fold nucleotide-binding protein involved in DNA uptake [Azoarcus sp. CIB]|uniref:DNA-processing protein DprA n=1 Tax=Aromatoleum sp. (strain CIB) TaxID=198107 RepID=UPI00067D4678|nr:DNA-processing protein DprA [Azoarcus sp. CIB]AKU09946.1 SMF protein, Rossmann fold nucleotide-binding protein involved in DNA uptake [Azoarcus sp. CIB]
MEDDLAAWLRLTLLPGIGPERQRSLLAAFGLPGQVFAAGRSAITAVAGAGTADLLFAAPDEARIAAALAWAAEPGNHILTLGDAAYPPGLLEIPDPPVLLYVKGDPALLAGNALAIVGARSATPGGVANAQAFAEHLAAAGLTIVSGLALGIDAAAHRGALDHAEGKTVAVIGTGADRVYPARNQALAREIAQRGAIVSELPLGTPALPHNFPRRNRLIAGLARGVLVVEAAVGSGSLITARLASECGREVFAIPGSIHSPLARGCHRLIRDGAKLVETAADVLDELAWGGTARPPAQPATRSAARGRKRAAEEASQVLFPPPAPDADLPPDQAAVLDALGHDPLDVDTLAARSGLTLDALYAILLSLELDGRISRLPGGRFQRY